MAHIRRVLAGLALLYAVASNSVAYGQTVSDPVTDALQGVTNVIPTPPTTFVGIAPCRLADTRGNGFSGLFGPPSMIGNAARIFPVAGHCGIPMNAQAVSANMAVTNTSAAGFISVWPGGDPTPVPLVASMNYAAGQTIANAVLAPLGGGGITVFARVGLDLIIDVNGYFISAPQNLACGFGQSVTGFDASGAAICGTPVATFVGVQVNTPVSALRGWTECFKGTYDAFSPTIAAILNACPGNNLLLACRPTGSSTLTTFAHAPRADVIFDTGFENQTTTHIANGVGWYFNDNWSWGFAPAGQVVNKFSCDTASVENGDRLCWHAGGSSINSGFRCGSTVVFNATFERLIFQAN